MIRHFVFYWRTGLIILLGALSLPIMMILAATIGDIPVTFATAARAITNGLGITHFDLPPVEAGIVWQYRMSRALMAACSGGGLALCGLVLQSLLRNPLADPYLLGISAGASTGAVSVMLLGIGSGAITAGAGAFIGACIAFMLIILLSGGMRENAARIILAGIAGTQLFNALTSYIVSTAANAEQSRGVMFWLLGSLSGVRWADALLCCAVVVIGLLIVICYARSLDTFNFGTEVSATLGTRVLLVRVILLLTTALITAVIVSAIGAVGFVGLVIPHITRMLAGHRHLITLPVAFLAGCHFMILADLLSRTLINHQVLPIGVVTSLVGAPVFALILYRNREK
ncbi:iron chelate uptake ABC transporter family permease subunit [Kosakonia sp. SMBL-WEM22]|uniref:FecCD family ABC transporter permease n=1 Tax=Kosakonia sp. SMBL-WEM22 TaxID=2725560 RepID=UPI001659B352|nr:iron chelate uptake ABC transporter family permease subunit [Kosakonia sp. SMBL-WEM22]QNQ21383.1 iron chelate uptake ABC transporter family permease subunit [Kosakonia sp. SMBL-WEM22]